MNKEEFISLIKSRGAMVFPASSDQEILFANTDLQNMRAAMLANFIQDLYKSCSAITMGSA
jgi:hypothetical protein